MAGPARGQRGRPGRLDLGAAVARRRAALAVLAALLAPATARADPQARKFPDLVGWYISPGLTFAEVSGTPDSGILFGGEVSLVHFDDDSNVWLGGYVDGARDFGRDSDRGGVGGEAGYGIFGIDAGVELSYRDGDVAPGVRGRGFVSLGYVALYGGYERVDGEDIGEVGWMLKIPLRVKPRRPIWTITQGE